MKKLKSVVAGLVSLCMLSSAVVSVSADEISISGLDDLFNQSFTPTIGDSSQSLNLAEVLDVYKDTLKELEISQDEIASLKETFENLKDTSYNFEDIKQQLQDAIDNNEDIKDKIDEIKETIQEIQGSKEELDNSISQYFETLKDTDWQSFVDSNVDFGDLGKFQLKEDTALGEEVISIFDKYKDVENYIATKSEEWFSNDDYKLNVQFSNEDGKFEVKFNPIYDDDTVVSCYMYVVSDSDDDTIEDGYIISEEDYANIKDTLNSTFLKDNIVAIANNITDFDDFMQYINDTYETISDYFYDVDGDGNINAVDLLKDKKFVLGMEVELGNYDSNNDGSSDSRDLLDLKKKLLSIE
jgi:prefoldin subunit 5